MGIIRTVLVLSILLLPVGNLEADTFQVTKTADTNATCTPDDCSLREAIGAANANAGADDAPVPAGTYLLTLGQLTLSDDVTITGAGQESTIIDGNASDRVFEIRASVVAEISGVTIQNGSTVHGGGIENSGDLTLSDSTVSGNAVTGWGGGIWNGGNLALTNSTVSGNTTTGYYSGGGGIDNRGDLTLTNSTVSGNTGASYYTRGGGIRNEWRATATLTNSTVSGNTATGDWSGGGGIDNRGYLTLTNSTVSGNWGTVGGGIANYSQGAVTLTGSMVNGNLAASGGGIQNRGTATLTDSTVSGNSTGVSGGGIHNQYPGTLTLTNSTVSGNSTSNPGGGIHNHYKGTVTLTNSTVSDNTSFWDGGGIANDWLSTVTLVNSTVSGNNAVRRGGGIWNYDDSSATLTNAIIADNSAPTGANCEGPVTSLGYNLTDNASCGFSATGDLVVADAMLGPLADNGGATETHALLPGSPAIDAGSPSCPPPDTDQRGVTRPQGVGCGIGAVEVPEPGSWLMFTAGLGILMGLRRVSRLA